MLSDFVNHIFHHLLYGHSSVAIYVFVRIREEGWAAPAFDVSKVRIEFGESSELFLIGLFVRCGDGVIGVSASTLVMSRNPKALVSPGRV